MQIDIFEEESRKIGFNIADYYLFSKQKYQLTLIYRCFTWEFYALIAGLVCYYIPFSVYGYGVVNSSGMTDDLFSIYFAAYQANIVIHHMQLYVTIRNYTKVFAVSCVVSISALYPITMIMCNYELFPSENLWRHIGEIIFDQFFYQASSVVLASFIVVMPIYIFKTIKMRFVYPHFYPQGQSTCDKE